MAKIYKYFYICRLNLKTLKYLKLKINKQRNKYK